MNISDETNYFDSSNAFLGQKISELAHVDASSITEDEIFLAEAIAFRIFRACERFTRAIFLHSCTTDKTANGKEIVSKLHCEDWTSAENILKAGNRFLDWGNPTATLQLAKLVFAEGFPIRDVLSPIHSTLVDILRVRNFIAHDSQEALSGFSKVSRNYLSAGSPTPEVAGRLLLSRKDLKDTQVLRKLFCRVSAISMIYSEL